MAGSVVIIGEAKVMVHAGIARVFEALIDPGDLARWWSPEAVVEPQIGGRYETRPEAGRQVGSIVSLLAPRRLVFTWPMVVGESEIETTVSYELWAHGAETEIHVVHRSPRILDPSWQPPWSGALAALKAYLEAEITVPPGTEPGDQTSA